jgi:hypothetical protein
MSHLRSPITKFMPLLACNLKISTEVMVIAVYFTLKKVLLYEYNM